MKILKITLIITSLVFTNTIFSQDSLLVDIASKHTKTFNLNEGEFKGAGWDFIKEQLKQSQNVLIGEEHFSNEIPVFVQAIANEIAFDNFYIEVDPYSTKIIKESIENFSEDELKTFNKEYGGLFSFYALPSEYKLLNNLVKSGVNLLGSDQVIMYADRLIFQDLLKVTTNRKAKDIYKKVINESEIHLNKFFENPQNPMYFMTSDFKTKLNNLKTLELSERESVIIHDMLKSIEIYQTQNHKKRIQLIMRQLMVDYPQWKDSKNLFKYGSTHMARGESLLTIYDIGNLIANITSSQEQKSFHMMIVGESGETGSAFKIFPSSPVDLNSEPLNSILPFANITEGNQWHMFDLLPLRKALNNGTLKIENINLQRIIKGYDALIIVPELTASKFD